MKLTKTQLKQIIKEEIQSLNESQIDMLYNAFTYAMNDLDPNMSYETFAKIVAKILIEDYGTHNYEPFLTHLKALLK
jgi:hypothetical protein